jgi:hypothetical protein
VPILRVLIPLLQCITSQHANDGMTMMVSTTVAADSVHGRAAMQFLEAVEPFGMTIGQVEQIPACQHIGYE